jgi:putative DNA primase/helicase
VNLRDIAHALGGEVSGRQVLCPGPGHSRNDRSLSVKIEPTAPGGLLVNSFAGDDPIACKDYVRSKIGLPEWQPGEDDRDRTIHPSKVAAWDQATREREIEEQRAMTGEELERAERAVTLWNEAQDPRGTAAERYLHSRCLDLAPEFAGSVLRFHPRTPWRDENAGRTVFIPCLLAAFRSISDDKITAVHRIRVDQPKRWPKTERRMSGIVRGAAIKLAPPQNKTLVIAEGVETAMAAMHPQVKLGPAWALGSVGAVSFFPVIEGVRHLIIAQESGAASAEAVKLCTRRWQARGRRVSIAGSHVGSDLNDAIIELRRQQS